MKWHFYGTFMEHLHFYGTFMEHFTAKIAKIPDNCGNKKKLFITEKLDFTGFSSGAGNGGRTRDPQLGKLMLYH